MSVVITNSDGSTRELTKEEFIADLEKAKAESRKKQAEAEHLRKLQEEQAAESARDNRRVKANPSNWASRIVNAIIKLMNESNMEYKVNGNSIILRTDEADYEIKVTKKKQRQY